MDKKVFRLTLLTIFSALVLVFVVIYVTNADKLSRLFGKKNTAVVTEAVTEEASETNEVIYGQQIGDDVKSFMYDDSFFDEAEKIPSVVVIQKNSKTTGNSVEASTEEKSDDEEGGSGMAVVGQLDNPGADSDSLQDDNVLNEPDLIQGTIDPSQDTIGGTPVGELP
ncbi:hypothetical protein [Butyrivibrio sp. YAB3001]|uniref:hypothetical protein n=1 Tax=Butyrivibrio sp. YAB3001 TaxID=1520812 RepID=UPI0008F68075|nr:hypothetical protein [Butyrivibrio sp. YAB3001]SFC77871.1 hypothetical protein SAMN02910398_03131 [Butyrivibrio sp. YAB3001]